MSGWKRSILSLFTAAGCTAGIIVASNSSFENSIPQEPWIEYVPSNSFPSINKYHEDRGHTAVRELSKESLSPEDRHQRAVFASSCPAAPSTDLSHYDNHVPFLQPNTLSLNAIGLEIERLKREAAQSSSDDEYLAFTTKEIERLESELTSRESRAAVRRDERREFVRTECDWKNFLSDLKYKIIYYETTGNMPDGLVIPPRLHSRYRDHFCRDPVLSARPELAPPE